MLVINSSCSFAESCYCSPANQVSMITYIPSFSLTPYLHVATMFEQQDTGTVFSPHSVKMNTRD